MKNNVIQYCEETGKYCYSSQAKALRAKNRYTDIKRVYYCHDCDKWHTTSMGITQSLRKGIIKKTNNKTITHKDIQKRLEELKRNKEA